ncbi:HPr(Ser) kinase/phosphatase [Candidatus Mycoplasma mahonii]|uniref:HPr(Ser) kinase/phosphatase n=1 Tax=Candidatus Mycoplasma mahonii TaxID=3004105 RepID=UPI0026ED799B|nr:HPr(Ser) kinase/phosphatase [Candidatus Mycoplasma mahonii]WKX02504.1 HPr(Ser) kinase/phosphatase [Candidatus Mycoplasma mahonii]
MRHIIKELLDKFHLESFSPGADLTREIKTASIHRMGLELAGIKTTTATSIIAWGTKESHFLLQKDSDYIDKTLKSIITTKTPLVFLSSGFKNNKKIVDICKDTRTPLIISDLHLATFNIMVGPFISAFVAPTVTIHASLVIINGFGVIIKGNSGIGKSEAVLELIQKGHSFVSDDSVLLKIIGEKFYGESSVITKGFLEVRGIGLINIPLIYGLKSVKDIAEVSLIIELIDSEKIQEVDRLGRKDMSEKILNFIIPKIELPVKRGRSTSVLIEVAVEAFVARQNGMDPVATINARSRK